MKKTAFGFSLAGSIMIILFLAFINYTTSRGYMWYIYPAFAVLWWPASVFFLSKGKLKSFSVAGSILILAFLFLVNGTFSPWVPWILFAALPVIWWPVTMLLGERASGIWFSIFSFVVFLLYYGILNLYIFTGHPWIIYIAYALLWWPMTRIFLKHKLLFTYSAAGAAITIIFFIAVNLVTSPGVPWFVYPAFAILWWPLSMYFFVFKKKQA